MKAPRGFAWTLQPAHALQEMRLSAARTRLQDAVARCQAIAAALEQLEHSRAEQVLATAGRYDLGRHASSVLYLSHLAHRIVATEAQQAVAERHRVQASEACLRATRAIDALEAARDKAVEAHSRQVEDRLAREADMAWLARHAGAEDSP